MINRFSENRVLPVSLDFTNQVRYELQGEPMYLSGAILKVDSISPINTRITVKILDFESKMYFSLLTVRVRKDIEIEPAMSLITPSRVFKRRSILQITIEDSFIPVIGELRLLTSSISVGKNTLMKLRG